MTEETKPKITLEGIARSSASAMQSGQLSQQNNYASQLQQWYAYQQSKGAKPEDMQMYNYGQEPEKLSQDMAMAAEIDRKKTIKEVESGLNLILGKLDEGSMGELAIKFGLKDKKYLTLTQAIQSDDKRGAIQSIEADYLGRNKENEYLIAWAKNMRPQSWLTYGGLEIEKMQQDFAIKNLYSEAEIEGKDGKKEKTAKYDPAKGKEFLSKTILGLKNEEKEQALFEMGQVAMSIFTAEEQAKKKKAEEESKNAQKK